jgi:hypothetical protein
LVGYPNHKHSNHEIPSYIQVWDLKEKIKLHDKKLTPQTSIARPGDDMSANKSKVTFTVVECLKKKSLIISLVGELGLYDLDSLAKISTLDKGIWTNIKGLKASKCGSILLVE